MRDYVRKDLVEAGDPSIDEDERTVTHVITTDAIDRDGEVILASGIDLTEFRKNPVVLLAHGPGLLGAAREFLPIGKNLWIKRTDDGRGLVAKTQFAKTALGEEVFQLYRERVMRMWSIGGKARNAGPATPEEIRGRPELAATKRIVRSMLLLEYSAVPIGCNPDALTIAVGKGLALPDWFPPSDPPKVEKGADPEPPAPEPEPELPRIPAGARSRDDVVRSLVCQLERKDWAGVVASAAADAIDRIRGRA